MKFYFPCFIIPKEKTFFEQIYKNWIRKALKTRFLFSAVYSAHKNLWNCITCLLIYVWASPEMLHAAWWKKFNFLLRWFFVFCLVIIFFYLFFSCFIENWAKRNSLGGWAWWLVLNSVYQFFVLWKFMWSLNWMVRPKKKECKATDGWWTLSERRGNIFLYGGDARFKLI